jgi:hypothetical protein
VEGATVRHVCDVSGVEAISLVRLSDAASDEIADVFVAEADRLRSSGAPGDTTSLRRPRGRRRVEGARTPDTRSQRCASPNVTMIGAAVDHKQAIPPLQKSW